MISQSGGNSNTSDIRIGEGIGDTSVRCRHHLNIEHRLNAVELEIKHQDTLMDSLFKRIESVAAKQWSPKIIAAAISLIGVFVATAGSFAGQLLAAYLKSKGVF